MVKVLLYEGGKSGVFVQQVNNAIQYHTELYSEEQFIRYTDTTTLRSAVERFLKDGQEFIILRVINYEERELNPLDEIDKALDGFQVKPVLKIYILDTLIRDPNFSEDSTFRILTSDFMHKMDPSVPDESNAYRPLLFTNALADGRRHTDIELGGQVFSLLYSISMGENNVLGEFLRKQRKAVTPLLAFNKTYIYVRRKKITQSMNELFHKFRAEVIFSKNSEVDLKLSSPEIGEAPEGEIDDNYQRYMNLNVGNAGHFQKLLSKLNIKVAKEEFVKIIQRQKVRGQRTKPQEYLQIFYDQLIRRLKTYIKGNASLKDYDSLYTEVKQVHTEYAERIFEIRTRIKNASLFTRFKNSHDIGIVNILNLRDRYITLKRYMFWLQFRNMRPKNAVVLINAIGAAGILILCMYSFVNYGIFSQYTFFQKWAIRYLASLALMFTTHFVIHRLYLATLVFQLKRYFSLFDEKMKRGFREWLNEKITIFGDMNSLRRLRQKKSALTLFLNQIIYFQNKLERSMNRFDKLLSDQNISAVFLENTKQGYNNQSDELFDNLQPPEILQIDDDSSMKIDVSYDEYFLSIIKEMMRGEIVETREWSAGGIKTKIIEEAWIKPNDTWSQLSSPREWSGPSESKFEYFASPEPYIYDSKVNQTNAIQLPKFACLAIHLCFSEVGPQ